MRRLLLILVSCVGGCTTYQAVNPYPSGTPEYVQWQDERNLRLARHTFMFEGHEGDPIVNEPSPSSIFRRQYRDTASTDFGSPRQAGQTRRAAIQGVATATPMMAPMLHKMMIRRMRVTGLVQKPFTLPRASGRFSRSLTVGRLKNACTMPVTQPTADERMEQS